MKIDRCPMCEGNHKDLRIKSEKKIVFRGKGDLEIFEVILVCPNTKEEFKATVKRRVEK